MYWVTAYILKGKTPEASLYGASEEVGLELTAERTKCNFTVMPFAQDRRHKDG
jgi:hypothetical protein